MSRGTNQLFILLLHPDIESEILNAYRHTATGSYVDLKPERLQMIVAAIRKAVDMLPADCQVPQILTTMEVRSSVRRLVATSIPALHAVSYQELGPEANIQPVGRIELDGFSPRLGEEW